MVGGHVELELLAVGAGGGFPARGAVDGVEVVGEVLGVGVANLPAGRETGFSLERERKRGLLAMGRGSWM